MPRLEKKTHPHVFKECYERIQVGGSLNFPVYQGRGGFRRLRGKRMIKNNFIRSMWQQTRNLLTEPAKKAAKYALHKMIEEGADALEGKKTWKNAAKNVAISSGKELGKSVVSKIKKGGRRFPTKTRKAGVKKPKDDIFTRLEMK